jgi:hypothetical protein
VATLSGGYEITHWEQSDNFWTATVPIESIRQFFVNGARKIRARYPNLSDPSDGSPYLRLGSWDLDHSSIIVPTSDVPLGASDSGVELIVQKHWDIGVFRTARLNESGGATQIELHHPDVELNHFEYPQKDPGQPYRLENSKHFLDSPGEWFFDKRSKTVYYYPEPGQVISSTTGFVPLLETLVNFRQTKGISLDRLRIEYSAWNRIDATGYGDDQGSIWLAGASMSTPVDDTLRSCLLIGGAVEIDSSEGIRIRRCSLRHLGGQGVLFQGTTRGNRIFGNRIEDVAANGIGFRQSYQQSESGSIDDTVDQNVLTKIGQFYTGSAAINAMYPVNIRIEHNRIFETPYSGISLGWGGDWDGVQTPAQGNLVRYNDISRTCLLHDDGGGIYTLGLQPNSSVSENWIHEISRGE